jgi:hypothetical protein
MGVEMKLVPQRNKAKLLHLQNLSDMETYIQISDMKCT